MIKAVRAPIPVCMTVLTRNGFCVQKELVAENL